MLPRCNAFIRRLIYQTVDEKLFGKVSLVTKTVNRDKVLVVTKPKSQTEKENEEQERIKEELKDFDDALGFTKVLRTLANSVIKKYIIFNFCNQCDKVIICFLVLLPLLNIKIKQTLK